MNISTVANGTRRYNYSQKERSTMKIKGKDIHEFIKEDSDYELQEIQDILQQIKKEKEEPDSGDFIIFHGKTFRVRKSSYDTIRKVMRSPLLSQMGNPAAVPQSWFTRLPFVGSIVEIIQDRRMKKTWREFCRLTFEGDLSLMELGPLSFEEVRRLMRIFFRFQEALFQDVREKPSQVSQA